MGFDAADRSVSLPVGFYTRTGVKPTAFWWQPHPFFPLWMGWGTKTLPGDKTCQKIRAIGPGSCHPLDNAAGGSEGSRAFPRREFPQRTGIIGEIIGISERFGEDAKGKRAGEVGAGFGERSGGGCADRVLPPRMPYEMMNRGGGSSCGGGPGGLQTLPGQTDGRTDTSPLHPACSRLPAPRMLSGSRGALLPPPGHPPASHPGWLLL